jgi:DNA-binding MarR family transcriptional regulator
VSKQREALAAEVARAAADFGAASDAVDQAVSARLGVNRTDLRILDSVHRAGALTAGEAAAAASLSPAATSTAIQRLVAVELLRREADPGDRRRAVLTLTATAAAVIEDCYGPIGREGLTALAGWSARELQVIRRFLADGIAFQRRHADRITATTPGA